MTGKNKFFQVFRSNVTNIHTLAEANKVDEIITAIKKQPELMNQPTTSGLTALHIACSSGYIGLVETLINLGADVNKRDNAGWTPLHCCCASKHTNALSICKLLLVNGKAQAEVLTNSGTSPLHYIVRGENEDMALFEEVIQLLIEGGNYVDSQSKFGETPLHQAAQSGVLSAVRILLRLGANCNALTKVGESALHVAVRSKHLEVVKLLLSHGANPKLSSTSGDCFSYCERWSLHDIGNYLHLNYNDENNNDNVSGIENKEEIKNDENESENIVIRPKRETFSIDTSLVEKMEKLGFEASVIISSLYTLYQKSMPVNDEQILLAELSSTNNVNTECKVCMHSTVNCVLLPCRHACLCVDCAESCKSLDACPICRQPINEVIPIFLS